MVSRLPWQEKYAGKLKPHFTFFKVWFWFILCFKPKMLI